MDIVIKVVEASKTAVVAGPFDLSRLMPSYDEVYAFLRGGDSDVKQMGQNVALYTDDRMEVGVEVDRDFQPVGDVSPSQLPAGRVAAAMHTTGYADMGATYEAIAAWCTENGHTLAGPRWETYGDPDEHDHVNVEICYLLA
jgi:effector-binding domain-containing protein